MQAWHGPLKIPPRCWSWTPSVAITKYHSWWTNSYFLLFQKLNVFSIVWWTCFFFKLFNYNTGSIEMTLPTLNSNHNSSFGLIAWSTLYAFFDISLLLCSLLSKSIWWNLYLLFVAIVLIQVEKRPYRECAGEKVPSIPSECVGLRETYFNCKRGQACKQVLQTTSTKS